MTVDQVDFITAFVLQGFLLLLLLLLLILYLLLLSLFFIFNFLL